MSEICRKDEQERQKKVVLSSRGNLRTTHLHNDEFMGLADRNYHRQQQDNFHRKLKDKIAEQRKKPPTDHYLYYYDYDKGYDYSDNDSDSGSNKEE